MSSKRLTVKQNDIFLGFKRFFSLINCKSIIKNVFNISIYFILIIFFMIIAHVPKLAIFLFSNINSLDIIIIMILTYFLNLIIFTKILSVRINYDTLFFKCSRVLSWKQTLKEYFPSICWLTFYITLGVTKIPSIVANSFISHYDPEFWINPRLANAALIEMTILLILQFEIWFWFLILFEKSILLLMKGYRRVNSSNKTKSKSFDNLSDLVAYKPTKSILLLIILLITSILSAKVVSEQIDYYFLDPTSFNLKYFVLNFLFAFIILIHIIISLNSIIFSYLNIEYDGNFKANIKSNFYMFLGSYVIFLNAIYFVKYLTIAFIYDPIDTNNPEINAISTLTVLAGGLAYSNPINLKIMAFIDYFAFSILFTMFIYIIFFYLNSTPSFLEFKLKYKQKLLENYKEPISSKDSVNLQSRIIKKLFLKQLRKKGTVKKFTYFYYIYAVGVPFIASVFDLYLLVKDSTFGHNSYSIHVFKYQYAIGAYVILLIIFSNFLEVARKVHKIPLTSIVKKETLNKYFKYLSIHFSITTSCFIAIFINWVYRLSKDYGDIVAPEQIQTIQLLFLFLASEYVLSNISQKAEEILNEAIEKGSI